METNTAVFAVVSGLVIRLAIPIGITAIAIYFLRHLDTRWKIEAEKELLYSAVEKPKCWEINGCSAEMRETCAGYQSKLPCWQAFRQENGYMQERCLGCAVFLKAPVPVKI